MTLYDLIGMPYRLGATPEQHGAADCLSLARTVLEVQGFDAPPVERGWYRRLYRCDYTVFPEQLNRYCDTATSPKIGVIALCTSEKGYGMASFFDNGWLCFVESAVTWKPLAALEVVGLYCLSKYS